MAELSEGPILMAWSAKLNLSYVKLEQELETRQWTEKLNALYRHFTANDKVS